MFSSLRLYVWGRAMRAGCRVLIFVSAIVTVCFFWGELSPEPDSDLSTYFHQDAQFSKPFLIKPNLNCSQLSNTFTVITVISKSSNSLQRQTIRETWGHLEMQKKYHFKLYFLLGTEKNINIDNECNLNGDIVQTNITESYYHLTEKTVDAFKWMTLFCHNASFFFKLDDDVYLDLNFLREIVNDRTYVPDDVVLGHCVFHVKPSRDWSKYGVSRNEYPVKFKTYPPYCGGPGYTMTLPTARKIYHKMTTTRVFKFEDVYVGIVVFRLGMSVKPVKYFVHLMNKGRKKQDFYIRCSRVTHNLSPDDIQQLWNQRNKNGNERHDCF